MHPAFATLTAACALTLIACSEAPPKNKAAAEAKAAALEALGKKPLPALSEDKLNYAGPPLKPVRVSGGTSVMFALEALSPLKDAYTTGALFKSPPPLQQSIAWLTGVGPIPKGTKTAEVEEEYAKVEHIEYVLVIKTVELKKATVDGETFTGGSFKGEAHLITVGGEHHGGVRFSGANSDSVLVNTRTNTETGKSFTNDNGVLESDLRDRAWDDLNAKLNAQLPGSVFELR